MTLVEFPEQTVIIAEDQPEYLPLPAYQYGDATGTIVCCWQLTWRERFTLLFTGTIWHRILTFHQKLQPQSLVLEKPDMPKQEPVDPRNTVTAAEVETLRALTHAAVFDGDLPSKAARDSLVEKGLAYKWEGWNFLTAAGVTMAIKMGMKIDTRFQPAN